MIYYIFQEEQFIRYIIWFHVFSSNGLVCHMSYCRHLESIVCLSICPSFCKLFTFWSSPLKLMGQLIPKLTGMICLDPVKTWTQLLLLFDWIKLYKNLLFLHNLLFGTNNNRDVIYKRSLFLCYPEKTWLQWAICVSVWWKLFKKLLFWNYKSKWFSITIPPFDWILWKT